MRLFTASEMRAIDSHAISSIGIPGPILMENAGLKILFTLEKHLSGLRGKKFTIVCGKGNNGGDGFVVARHLLNNGISTNVFTTCDPDEMTNDARLNFNIFTQSGYEHFKLSSVQDLARLHVASELSDVLTDAIFGTGFKGQVTGFIRDVIKTMNAVSSKRIAVDVPSGLDASTGRISETTFRADMTITLGAPKTGLFMFPGMEYAGEVWVADIGIPQTSYETVNSRTMLITPEIAAGLLPYRSENSHKGSFGHLLVLCGSEEFGGAGILAAFGGLRSGTGLVTLAIPESTYPVFRREIPPEIIQKRMRALDGGFHLSGSDVSAFKGSYNAIVAGSGWGRGKGQSDTLRALIDNWSEPLILDADSLNALSEIPEFRAQVSKNASCNNSHDEAVSGKEFKTLSRDLTITPHLGEMSRLTGQSIPEIRNDLFEAGKSFVAGFPCTLVLKSATPMIFGADGSVYISSKANSGLAKGGSGDLLSGIIGGLIARGMQGLHAAVLGVYLHSDAGEKARKKLGPDAMTISEVISFLPESFENLYSTASSDGFSDFRARTA